MHSGSVKRFGLCEIEAREYILIWGQKGGDTTLMPGNRYAFCFLKPENSKLWLQSTFENLKDKSISVQYQYGMYILQAYILYIFIYTNFRLLYIFFF